MKNYFKVLGLIALVCVLLTSFTFTSSAWAAKDSLPEIVRWVNGAAQSEDGTYLSDTWAVDKTNVSDAKYVLINQDGTEELRVQNYPDDISLGNTVPSPTYVVSFKLKVPETVTNEVIITLENDGATYTLAFNEENKHSTTESFYPGDYEVSDIEATGSEKSYVLSEDLLLSVTDKDLDISLELTENGAAANGTEGGSESAEGEGALDIIKSFDTNGDLMWDTIGLCIAVVILLVIYVLIQHKRKKAEEINH